MKKVAIICGPYRANTIEEITRNIRFAESYAKKYWKFGYVVICPHKNTALFDGLCNDKIWLEGVQELLRRSDTCIFIPGFEKSLGSLAEYNLAKALQKEIIIETGEPQ